MSDVALWFDPWAALEGGRREPLPPATYTPPAFPRLGELAGLGGGTPPKPKPEPTQRRRPVSWARPDILPQPGDVCGCCGGSKWWTSSPTPDGWCCCRCHPPCHLQPGEFRAVAT